MRPNRHQSDARAFFRPSPASRQRLRDWKLQFAGAIALMAWPAVARFARHGTVDMGGAGGFALMVAIAVVVVGTCLAWLLVRNRRLTAAAGSGMYARVTALELEQLRDSRLLAWAVASVKWHRLDLSSSMGVNGDLKVDHGGISWSPGRGARRLGAAPWALGWVDVESVEIAGRSAFLHLADGAVVRFFVAPKVLASTLLQVGAPQPAPASAATAAAIGQPSGV